MEELEILNGTVGAVVFQNYENGYAVLRLRCQDGQMVTVVGTIPLPAVGERLMVTGRWSAHQSYGKQFEAEFLERLMPQTKAEILGYLSSRIVKGIGPKSAARIVEHFGEQTLQIMEREPARLAEVSGISANRAKIIGEEFRRELSTAESMEVSRLLHSLSDIERISDHSVNVMKAAKEIEEKEITFSENAKRELKIMSDAVEEIVELTTASLVNEDATQANKVEPLVKMISKLKHKIKKNHIRRLREGRCTVGTVLDHIFVRLIGVLADPVALDVGVGMLLHQKLHCQIIGILEVDEAVVINLALQGGIGPGITGNHTKCIFLDLGVDDDVAVIGNILRSQLHGQEHLVQLLHCISELVVVSFCAGSVFIYYIVKGYCILVVIRRYISVILHNN